MTRARENADHLVRPAIEAIYERPDGSDHATKQIGTGFRINYCGRPVLVTARHTLYGHHYDKDPECPWQKHIVFDGRLRPLFELRTGEVGYLESHDVAAVFVDEIGLAGSLPMSCLVSTEATCRLISIYGLLSRDFRRELSTGLLSPTPYFYANECAAYGPGYTGIGAVTGTRNGGAKAGSFSWDQAAVAARHIWSASSLRTRSVARDVRWRWTLKVLWTTA